MFVDDDVMLGPDCVATLLHALETRLDFAALAADYNNEMKPGRGNWDYPPHVGMGATLFRRERLEKLEFRWEDKKCECQCCCDDLRQAGYAIGYLPGAIAWHKREPSNGRSVATSEGARSGESPKKPARILAAFDRGHFLRFRRQFLPTLRAFGNSEIVTAVAYGLRPAETRVLARLEGLEVLSYPPDSQIHPAHRRIRDFATAIADWPKDTPVAFWDAGDVLFQSSLHELWDLVRAHSDELLVVPDPLSYPENKSIDFWVSAIACAGSPSRVRVAFDPPLLEYRLPRRKRSDNASLPGRGSALD